MPFEIGTATSRASGADGGDESADGAELPDERSALFPAESARRRCIETFRPAEPASDSVRAGAAPLADVPAGAVTAATDAGTAFEAAAVVRGSSALRSPLRTRSLAGGNATFPADKARRRAIETERPSIATFDEADMRATLTAFPRDTR
jgi:hypothetical protein